MAMVAEAERRAGRLGRHVGTTFEALERRLLRQAHGVVSITDDFRAGARRVGRGRVALHGDRELGPAGRPARAPPRQRLAGRARAGRPIRLPLHRNARSQAPSRAAVPAGRAAGRRRRGGRHQRGPGRAAPARDAARSAPAQPPAPAVPADGAATPTSSGRPMCSSPCSSPPPGRSRCRRRCCPTSAPAAPSWRPSHPRTLRPAPSSARGAGLVVSPTDEEAFLVAAKHLRVEDSLRQESGRRRRAPTLRPPSTPTTITDRFETVIDRAVARRAGVPSAARRSEPT